MPRSMIVTVLLAGSMLAGFEPLSGQSRAEEIAAVFTKHKFALKERHGVQREKFKDVWSEPTLRPTDRDYVGAVPVYTKSRSWAIASTCRSVVMARCTSLDPTAQRRAAGSISSTPGFREGY